MRTIYTDAPCIQWKIEWKRECTSNTLCFCLEKFRIRLLQNVENDDNENIGTKFENAIEAMFRQFDQQNEEKRIIPNTYVTIYYTLLNFPILN